MSTTACELLFNKKFKDKSLEDRQAVSNALAKMFQKHIEALSRSLSELPKDKRSEVLKGLDEKIEILFNKIVQTGQS